MADEDQGAMAREATLAGSLVEVSYPELLKKLHDESLTGSLTLRRYGVEKTLYVKDGRVIFARSTNEDDRLGEFLVRKGAITLAQYLGSVELIRQGRRQGTALVELGAIQPDELVRYVTDQVQEILYSLFLWARGDFELRLEELPLDEMIVLNISIEEVLVHGMRLISHFSRIWRGLGESLGMVYAPTPHAETVLYRVSLDEDESTIYSRVTGAVDLGHILDTCYASNFETLRTLWTLKVLGVIAPVDALADKPVHSEDYELEEHIEAYNRFFAFIYDFIAERLGELVDHITDRAVAQAGARFPRALASVTMHNHGRIEYEQIYANVSYLEARERKPAIAQTLGELLYALMKLTRIELGPEDERFLVDQLELLGETTPEVPIRELSSRL